MVGERVGRTLYHLAITVNESHESACFCTPPPSSMDTWHQRLAYVSIKRICKMNRLELVDGLKLPIDVTSYNNPCSGCMAGKMQRSSFKLGRTRAKQVGQLIHADVCGPMQVTTPGGSRFFTMFTDDFS